MLARRVVLAELREHHRHVDLRVGEASWLVALRLDVDRPSQMQERTLKLTTATVVARKIACGHCREQAWGPELRLRVCLFEQLEGLIEVVLCEQCERMRVCQLQVGVA